MKLLCAVISVAFFVGGFAMTRSLPKAVAPESQQREAETGKVNGVADQLGMPPSTATQKIDRFLQDVTGQRVGSHPLLPRNVEAFVALLAEADEGAMPTIWERLVHSPSEHVRGAYLPLVLSHWVELNPNGALEYVVEKPMESEYVDFLLEVWASGDPIGLVETAKGLNDVRLRDRIAEQAIKEWAERDTDAAFAEALAWPGGNRATLVSFVLYAGMDDKRERMIDLIAKTPWESELREVLNNAWSHASAVAPRQTLEHWKKASFPDTATRDEIFGEIVRGLSIDDSSAAIEWAESQTDPSLRAEAMGAILKLGGSKAQDLDKYVAGILEHPSHHARRRILGESLSKVLVNDPAGVMKQLDQSVPDQFRSSVITQLLRSKKNFSKVPVETLVELVERQPLRLADEFGIVAKELANRESPELAVEWATSLGGKAMPRAVSEAIGIWAMTDIDSAASFVEHLKDVEARRLSSAAIIRTARDGRWDSDQISDWAKRMEEGE